MLIDQRSGLFERAIKEIEKLPGAFALQRNVLAFHQRRNCSLSRKLQAFSLSSYQPPPSSPRAVLLARRQLKATTGRMPDYQPSGTSV